MKKHEGSPAPWSAGSQLPWVRWEMAAHRDLGIGTYLRCKEGRVLRCLISHRLNWASPGICLHSSLWSPGPAHTSRVFINSSFYLFFFSQTPFFLQTTSLGNPSAEPPPPFATWDPWFSKSHWSVHAVCLYWWCSHVSSIIGFATLTGFRHYQNLQPAHTGSSQQEACLCLKVWNSVLDISTPPPPSPVDPIICCIMLFSLSCFSPTSVAHFSARAGEDLHSYCLFLFLLGPLPSESRHNHPQSLLQQVSVHLWVLRRVILRAVWPILARAIYAVCLAGSINIL